MLKKKKKKEVCTWRLYCIQFSRVDWQRCTHAISCFLVCYKQNMNTPNFSPWAVKCDMIWSIEASHFFSKLRYLQSRIGAYFKKYWSKPQLHSLFLDQVTNFWPVFIFFFLFFYLNFDLYLNFGNGDFGLNGPYHVTNIAASMILFYGLGINCQILMSLPCQLSMQVRNHYAIYR